MPTSDLVRATGLPALNAAILRRAQRDIPIVENPLYSNRSPEIDAMCRRWGVPLGSYWCALWAATVWADAGAEVPPIDRAKGRHPAVCQSWYEWALETGRFGSRPALGCAVLYGEQGQPPAHHMGVAVASVTPLLLDFEGNTSVESFGRNGEMTAVKLVNVERLIGYVYPVPI